MSDNDRIGKLSAFIGGNMFRIILICLVYCTFSNAQDIPAVHSISNEDNGLSTSKYVTLTIHFEDARIPDETVTISRKDMSSDSNIDYVIETLEKRFKKKRIQKELEPFDKPYYPVHDLLKEDL